MAATVNDANPAAIPPTFAQQPSHAVKITCRHSVQLIFNESGRALHLAGSGQGGCPLAATAPLFDDTSLRTPDVTGRSLDHAAADFAADGPQPCSTDTPAVLRRRVGPTLAECRPSRRADISPAETD